MSTETTRTEQGGDGARTDGTDSKRQRTPLFVETWVFLTLIPFFTVVALVYGQLTGYAEPVGFVVLFLLAGLCGLVGFFLWMTSRRISMRPEDDPRGSIDQGAGDYGEFAPHSWWPLMVGGGAAIIFLGIAVGWWICIIGAIVIILGLVGLILEFSRGQHAH